MSMQWRSLQQAACVMFDDVRWLGHSLACVQLRWHAVCLQVACLADNDARLAVDPANPFKLQTKPHGHGDVHALLHGKGLVKQWQAQGIRWVVFFQDTNALVFRGLLAALGESRTSTAQSFAGDGLHLLLLFWWLH